jgi:hypothetical protein
MNPPAAAWRSSRSARSIWVVESWCCMVSPVGLERAFARCGYQSGCSVRRDEQPRLSRFTSTSVLHRSLARSLRRQGRRRQWFRREAVSGFADEDGKEGRQRHPGREGNASRDARGPTARVSVGSEIGLPDRYQPGRRRFSLELTGPHALSTGFRREASVAGVPPPSFSAHNRSPVATPKPSPPAGDASELQVGFHCSGHRQKTESGSLVDEATV